MNGALPSKAPSDDSFPEFPPGPRWFACLYVNSDVIGIHLEEGTNTTNVYDLGADLETTLGADLGAFDVIYVFGTAVTTDELIPAVEAMFFEEGPRLSATFADRIEGIVMSHLVRVVPGEH